MRRFAILTIVLTVLSVIGSLGFLRAQSDSSHPFSTTWCDDPVVIDLVGPGEDGSAVAGSGVSFSQGAAAVTGARGPALSLNTPGSRVQVSLDQPLFHTQWLVSSVTPGDALRADIVVGNLFQPIDASSVRGALVASDEQSRLGLRTEAVEQPSGTGQIDVFAGVSQMLFTNEGSTPVELLAAIGCPALHVDGEQTGDPVWDETIQRFVAEHTVTVQNTLTNPRVRALRVTDPGVASTIVEGVSLDLDLAATGFSSAEVLAVEGSERLASRLNENFDGYGNTSLLDEPVRLVDADEEALTITVGYVPDFNDPAWAEGAAAPVPQLAVSGRVNDVAVGGSGFVQSSGLTSVPPTSADPLVAPTARIAQEVNELVGPRLRSDGRVVMAHEVIVTNDGEAQLEDLSIAVPYVDMFGPGTLVETLDAKTSGGCSQPGSVTFDGGTSSVLVFDQVGLGVEDSCTLSVQVSLIPGTQPDFNGTLYNTAVTASARSGARQVSDDSRIWATLIQDVSLDLEFRDVEVINDENGRHQVRGTISLLNDGALALTDAVVTLEVQRPLTPEEQAAASDGSEETDRVALIPVPVLHNTPVVDEGCGVVGGARAGAPSAPLSAGMALAPDDACELKFSFVAVPGQSLLDWQITARTDTEFTAVQPALSVSTNTTVSFSESPDISGSEQVDSITNNGDGTYTVRTVATFSNVGDTPLHTVAVGNDIAEVFDGQLRFQERIGDTCAGVSSRNPLHNAKISPDAHTCTVTTLSVIEPGTALDGDVGEWNAVATSTSGALVQTNVETSLISFTEDPQLSASIEVEAVERVDEHTVAFVLAGTLENTGDVEARNVLAQLDLHESFEGPGGPIPFDVRFLSVAGLSEAEGFEAGSTSDLFTGTEIIQRGDRADFRLLVHATPGDHPGPYTFTLAPSATSPAQADVRTQEVDRDATVPIIGVSSRSLVGENNFDGTYSIAHTVVVENRSASELASIEVFTGLERAFGVLLVGGVDVSSTCTGPVASGAQCEVIETASVRPGANLGPHSVSVAVSAADANGVDALLSPPPSNDPQPQLPITLQFVEAPGIDLDTDVSEVENNQDGTYTVTYNAAVTNAGDVPLYRVGVLDIVGSAFGRNVASAQIDADTCSQVSFSAPLAPGATCRAEHTVTVRPLANLGPWEAVLEVNALSPALVNVENTAAFDQVTFTESVSIDAEPRVMPGANNGDGTYAPEYSMVVVNTGDVPIVALETPDAGLGYGPALLETFVRSDSCTAVSSRFPLLPGAECTVDQLHTILPGSALGPYELDHVVSATSPSGAVVVEEGSSDAVTFTEDPAIELQSEVVSVENLDDGSFRLVENFTVTNAGDVRIDDVGLQRELNEVFAGIPYRIDGLISNEFVIDEAFATGESNQLLAPAQSLVVGAQGTVTLVVSVEPGNDVGPFTGSLTATATSPADNTTSSVISTQIDLPSVAVEVLTQSVANNRDGSYKVTSSYEVVNDGTTPLDFVRINEDLSAIYEGTRTELISIDGVGLSAADVTDQQRNDNLLAWGASLDAGGRAVMTSTVIVEPGNILGPFLPVVSAAGISPTGTVVDAEASAADSIEFVEQPALRVEQVLSGRPVWADDRFEVTFAISVFNDGDVELRGVQVREDLLNALGVGSGIFVSDIRSEDFIVNRNFDGRGRPPGTDTGTASLRADIGDTRLLSGIDTLEAGATGSIELDLVITPETRGVYNPRVVVSARTPGGAALGGGDEQIEANTLTRLSVQGELGVAKRVVGDATLQSNGSIAVTYEILVENAGPFPLDNVAVHDQLGQAFGVGSEFETSPVRIEPGSPCAGFASGSFDGGVIDPVLAAGFDLNSGERCRMQYDAVVTPSIALPGPYRSSALAIATDPFSGTVIDDSTDGTNADPDGNQEPGDNDIKTPVVIEVPAPSLDVMVEPLAAGALDAAGRFETGYQITVTNNGAVDVRASRVIVDLDDQWDGDFDVLSLESADTIVNHDFDAASDTNLLDRRSTIESGQALVFTLRLRAEQSETSELSLVATAHGLAVAGSSVSASNSEPVASNGPNGVSQLTLLDTMTTEEKRLLALGSTVILLFLALGIRSALAAVRSLEAKRAAKAAAQSTEPEEGYVYLDLRTREVTRSRPSEPVLDLSDEAVDTRDRDAHHRPRRRRGRPLQRS